MKNIVLASASPQRRELMKILGLPFIVRPSRAKEKSSISSGVAHLVKSNALLKAKEVALRIKDGLVIGSDTVVCSGKGRLILKPRDLHEAKKNLKELMSDPHWVYSGVAVVDAKTGRAEIGWEKTKVFMTPLNDQEINRYHQLVSPLDKAGGFDIEGKGALFIPRIEGCYFNVVGLPLAKLASLLKKFGVSVLCLLLILLSGPSYAAAVLPQVCDGKDCVKVEVVSKLSDMEKGLMGRIGLVRGKGMLFVFGTEDRQSFWMKNMLFDLDILWIGLDGHIVYLGQNIPRCISEPCPVYSPENKAKYVLELNSGYTLAHQWKLGDRLDLKGI
ncbi:MAG: septum formation protein Maf [Candidatus Omnitrophica bacterium]|nr:septum formation protein Maf [Candidatus Omnitrophota bacterium]